MKLKLVLISLLLILSTNISKAIEYLNYGTVTIITTDDLIINDGAGYISIGHIADGNPTVVRVLDNLTGELSSLTLSSQNGYETLYIELYASGAIATIQNGIQDYLQFDDYVPIEEPPLPEPIPEPEVNNTIYEDVIIPTVQDTQIDIVEDVIIDPIDNTINIAPVIIETIPTQSEIIKTEEVEPPQHELSKIPLFETDLNLTKDSLFVEVIKHESELLDEESFEEEELEDQKAFRDTVGADKIVQRIIKLQQLKIEIQKLKEKLNGTN